MADWEATRRGQLEQWSDIARTAGDELGEQGWATSTCWEQIPGAQAGPAMQKHPQSSWAPRQPALQASPDVTMGPLVDRNGLVYSARGSLQASTKKALSK